MSIAIVTRRASSPCLARALRVLALAAVAVALALGCGGEPAAPGAAAGCPSGSIAWTDGSCMPVGIQGCAEIFIEEDGLCHPRMEKCPAGTIPKFDEGCAPVGIQGCAEMFMEEDGLCHPSIAKCPAGTIPKFDKGCVPVGIQGCAEVFMEEDGLCHPTMEKCPEGTFAVPQGGCVPIDGPEGCGSGTWGNIQEEPGVATIWVDPSVVASGDGSKASPVKTIAEALALVPVGGRVALGGGTYDEPIHITKPMTIERRCPSMVRVQGTGPAYADAYVVWVDGASDVALQSLELGGAGIGILATDAAGLKIEGVRVRNATSAGIYLHGSSTEVSIARSCIDGTLAGDGGLYGRGVEVAVGAQATLAESAVITNHDVGVFAVETGTAVTLTDSLVEGTLPRESDGLFGTGAHATLGSNLTLIGSAVVNNHNAGAAAFQNTTRLALTNSLVEGTLPSGENDEWGEGVFAAERADLTVLGTAILDNHYVGIFAQDPGTNAGVTGSLVKGTMVQQSDGKGGIGVAALDAKLTLRDSAVIANDYFGLQMSGPATEVTATGVLLQSQGDMGILVNLGALLTLDGGAMVENRQTGIAARDAGTSVTVTGSLIAETAPAAIGPGDGVDIHEGAHALLEANAIIRNHLIGVGVEGLGTEVNATANLVTGTLPEEDDGTGGRGLQVALGAKLVLDANAIVENHVVGLYAGSSGTELTATFNLIEGTLPEVSSGESGRGIGLESGAQATLHGNSIVGNHDVGLFMGMSSAIATGNAIEGTLPRESDGHSVIGVLSSDGSTLELASSIVYSNRVVGFQVVSATATVSQSLINVVPDGSFTLINPTRMFDGVGDGLLAMLRSTVDVTDTRVQGCVRAGVLFDDSSGTLSGVVSTENQFGLVLQGERRPDYQYSTNQFSGNEKQDIVTGGDLPVPDAPPSVPPSP